MQSISKRALCALALCAAALSPLAQAQEGPSGALSLDHRAGATSTPRVDARQARQHQRISHGVASGALTRHEAHGLRHQQQHIRQAERHAKADGVVTRAERARLERMQDRASRHIRHQKHDRQQRPAQLG